MALAASSSLWSSAFPTPLAKWDFRDATFGTIEETNYPLTVTGSGIYPKLIDGKRGTARRFSWQGATQPASATNYGEGAADSIAVSAAKSSWVVHFWARRQPQTNPADEVILNLAGPVDDVPGPESEPNNVTLRVGWNSSGVAFVTWEYGAGVTISRNLTGLAIPTDDAWHSVSIRKTILSDGSCDLDGFLDGVLVSDVANEPNNASGGTTDPKWTMGTTRSSSMIGQLDAAVDEVQFFSLPLNDAQVGLVTSREQSIDRGPNFQSTEVSNVSSDIGNERTQFELTGAVFTRFSLPVTQTESQQTNDGHTEAVIENDGRTPEE